MRVMMLSEYNYSLAPTGTSSQHLCCYRWQQSSIRNCRYGKFDPVPQYYLSWMLLLVDWYCSSYYSSTFSVKERCHPRIYFRPTVWRKTICTHKSGKGKSINLAICIMNKDKCQIHYSLMFCLGPSFRFYYSNTRCLFVRNSWETI